MDELGDPGHVHVLGAILERVADTFDGGRRLDRGKEVGVAARGLEKRVPLGKLHEFYFTPPVLQCISIRVAQSQAFPLSKSGISCGEMEMVSSEPTIWLLA